MRDDPFRVCPLLQCYLKYHSISGSLDQSVGDDHILSLSASDDAKGHIIDVDGGMPAVF